MKKLFLSLVTIAIFPLLSSCNNSASTNLKKETDYYKDGSLHYETNYTYDSKNHLTEKLERVIYSTEKKERKTKITYNYAEDLLTSEYVSLFNENTRKYEDSNFKSYSYNNQGNVLSCISYTLKNDNWIKFNADMFDYDDKQNLISETLYYYDDYDSSFMCSSYFKLFYNNKNQLYKTESYEINFETELMEFLSYELVEYNDKNLPIKVTEFAASTEEQIHLQKYEYDTKNNLISEENATTIDEVETIYLKYTNEYNNLNLITKSSRKEMNELGELVDAGYTIYEY